LRARVSAGGADWKIELDRPVSLAIETRFAGEGPNAFGAPRASSHPLVVTGFNGSVAAGASCNCSTIMITPHCSGTHTECVGHLTAQPLDAIRVVPPGLVPAVLLTIAPERAGADRDPVPLVARNDSIITRRLLEAAWPRAQWPLPARAMVIRTLPNDEAKRRRDYTGGTAPYLSAEAARLLVERGIEHLIVDIPSVDRMMDEGRLAAHRAFFGLPTGATDLDLAARAHCTITELAYVPDSVPDGEYLLELQVPALNGDAVPSRPLLYTAERIKRRGRMTGPGVTRKRGPIAASGATRKRGRAHGRGARSKHGPR
jgi:arylformamidase